MKINIPDILVHLRSKAVDEQSGPSQMAALMKAASVVMGSGQVMKLVERGLPLSRIVAGRSGTIGWLPGIAGAWTSQRDIPKPPKQAFRHWWAKNRGNTTEAES